MPRISLPLAGEYQSDSLTISNVENVNCYVNIPQVSTFTESTLYGTDGLEQIATSGNIAQINRGSHVKSGVPYFVNGTTCYRLESDFTLTALGTIGGNERCSFADNGSQLLIVVPGENGYIIDESLGSPFQEIADPNFKANGNPQYCEFIDSFFVVTTDEKKFIKSASNDGLAWSALDFAAAEADPDRIVAPIVNKNRLFITGTETIEVFENTGGQFFPFQRINGFIIPKGVFAPYSLININETFMWIGGGVNEKAAIWQLNGSAAEKVSTTAIESEIQKYTNEEIAEAFAWTYSRDGAYFVGFSLPDACYVYDLSSGQWHERRSQFKDTRGATVTTRLRVNSVCTAYGRILCGDSQDGRIGELSESIYTEYGEQIIREFSIATVFNNGESFNIPEVELTMESGVGNDAQPEPEIRMATSIDSKRYSDFITRKIGAGGNYNARQIWRRLGRFPRFATIKFQYSDPCKFVAVKLVADINLGKQRAK